MAPSQKSETSLGHVSRPMMRRSPLNRPMDLGFGLRWDLDRPMGAGLDQSAWVRTSRDHQSAQPRSNCKPVHASCPNFV